jgi:CRISPR-associated endonuclease Csn1
MGKIILGLDMGSNSIGWAVVEEGIKLVATGSRIFPEGVNREKGIEVSKNETRRMARQIRRQYFRRKMRKMLVAKILMEKGMFPKLENLAERITEVYPDEVLKSFFRLDPYSLRAKAYRGEKLSLFELGRIFYQFAQRRGYKGSLQAGDEEGTIYDGKPEDGKPGINATREAAFSNGTLGNYLHGLDPLKERKRNRYVGRDLYLHEFAVIWENQRVHHPGVLNDELKSELGDPDKGLLFFQRSLKSQKSKVGRCTFEHDKPRCSQSHPVAELARLHQFVNSIVLDGTTLSPAQRKVAVEYLSDQGKNFDFIKLKKKLKSEQLSSNYTDTTKCPGSPFLAGIRKVFGKDRYLGMDLAALERIWNVKVFARDKEWLENYAIRNWGLDPKSADSFCKLRLEKQYAALSRKALFNILEHLENGFKYHEAVWLAGLVNAFGRAEWEKLDEQKQGYVLDNGLEILNRPGLNSLSAVKEWLGSEFGLSEKQLKRLYHHSDLQVPDGSMRLLPEFNRNIRNPLVEQTMKELRKVVNAVIEAYGKPDEIRIEMSRELKLPAAERQMMHKKQLENEDRNNKLKEELIALKLPPTANYLLRLKLFKELADGNGVAACPYSGKTIGMKDLFNDNFIQVEHIIPYSVSLDDSFANKTLCIASENQAKGDRTPYQFYGNDSSHWAQVKTRAKSLLPWKKYQRFTSEQNPALDEFVSRQLNDNRYSSRIALNYLMHICPKVRVSRGELTAKLRRLWGLDGVLTPTLEANEKADGAYLVLLDAQDQTVEMKPLVPSTYRKDLKQMEKSGFAASGYVRNGRFYFDKRREDHRHHALDAITIACSDTADLQKLSFLHSRIGHNEHLNKRFEVELPWPTFYRDVALAVRDVLVSYRKRIRAVTPVHKTVDVRIGGEQKKIRSAGLGARGQLHKESVYGRVQRNGETHFHIRKSLDQFTKVKDLEKIVDEGIRTVVSEAVLFHLGMEKLEAEMQIPYEAFFSRDEHGVPQPKVYLPNANGPSIPVRKVRIREVLNKAVQWHEGVNQWVNPRNNHHCMIYKDAEGTLKESVVSLWEVVERRRQGQPVYQLPPDGHEIVTVFQRNDLFMFRHLIPDEKSVHPDAIYRVQKFSDHDYNFRRAVATRVDNPNDGLRIKSIKKWQELNPIKVIIDPTGRLITLP